MNTMYRLKTWKVQITIREQDDETETYYFATEGLAHLAIEWAYALHLEALRARQDVHEIEEYPNLDDGSWKLRELAGKKVTWWQKVPKGYIAMKDYFTYVRAGRVRARGHRRGRLTA